MLWRGRVRDKLVSFEVTLEGVCYRLRTFIRHKDRQYKTETGTDRIKED